MKKKVLAIMLVAVSIMLISACGKKEKLYEIPDLSQYKTDYIGDSSNVINIVSGQEYPAGYSYDSIAVSYTHLFCLDRNAVASVSHGNNGILQIIAGTSVYERGEPVSYTHLDVYKRQVLSCRIIFS